MRIALPAYLLGLLMLFAVAGFGEIVNGARRWLDLGITRVQPSEMMRIAVPLMLATYFHRREADLSYIDYLAAAILLGLPVALIASQPDLGTALLIAASGSYVIFLAGLSWKMIAGLGIAAIGASPVAWTFLHDYQRERVLTLFNPEADPLGAGYHTIQSTIAVGSGGLFGKGWLHGTQTHLEFIPERSTDFIFAVFAEEFGFLGALAMLVGYLALVTRGLLIALSATTLFSRLLAGSISLTFFTYVFVNMGMVTGILPVVGVPLPLVSFGGTAMVTLCLSLGLLMSIHRSRALVQT
jgi:rod shape determining protein RodA